MSEEKSQFVWTPQDIDFVEDDSAMSRGFTRGPHGFSAGSKGCVMANLNDEQAKPILEYQKTIDSKDLADDGLETELHVTALYGLLSDSQGPVVEVCRRFGPLKATLGKIESFENPEYDVLKITVDSPDLRKVNSALKELPNSSDFPDYEAHLTLAYLKTGTAKKYVGSTLFEGIELTFDSLVFSDSQKNKRTIKLNDPANGMGQASDDNSAEGKKGDGEKEMQLIVDRAKALETVTDPIQREAIRCEILIAQDKLSSL